MEHKSGPAALGAKYAARTVMTRQAHHLPDWEREQELGLNCSDWSESSLGIESVEEHCPRNPGSHSESGRKADLCMRSILDGERMPG